MQLEPQYGDVPILRLDCGAGEITEPAVRQRRRTVEALRSLTDSEWNAPSRCEGWTVKDVAGHLASTNRFWNVSIQSGLAGAPTRFLAAFDPKATPAALAEAAAATPIADTLAEFEASTEELCRTIEGLSVDQLDVTAEAPPGHVAIDAVVHHALWDSWIHERDMLLPLGQALTVDDAEVACCLRYAVALSPSFALWVDRSAEGTVVVEATDPTTRFVADIGDCVTVHTGTAPDDALVLQGDAVALVEYLSVRGPYDGEIPDDRAWMVRGLADVFETAG